MAYPPCHPQLPNGRQGITVALKASLRRCKALGARPVLPVSLVGNAKTAVSRKYKYFVSRQRIYFSFLLQPPVAAGKGGQ